MADDWRKTQVTNVRNNPLRKNLTAQNWAKATIDAKKRGLSHDFVKVSVGPNPNPMSDKK